MASRKSQPRPVFEVIVRESAQEPLDKGLGRIGKSLNKLVEKEKLTREVADASLARLTGTLELADLADCDLVVEAIIEDLAIKSDLYANLGKLCKPETIFATNTSSFPVAEMGAASGRPANMVGLHFFNPVQLMKLVEVVRTPETDEAVYAEAKAFGESVGKVPVAASDTPGFVVNRLLVPYMADAMRMVERGDSTPADVDAGMSLGCGYPMGPFTLTDYVGLGHDAFDSRGMARALPGRPHIRAASDSERQGGSREAGPKNGRRFL